MIGSYFKQGFAEINSLLKKRNLRSSLSIFCVRTQTIENNNVLKEFFNEFERKIKTKRKLIGEILAKYCVAKILEDSEINDIRLSQITVKRNMAGMPLIIINHELKINKQIFISISHKDDWHVAVASFNKVGIDIERIRLFKSSLLNKIFTEEEITNALKIIPFLNSFNKTKNTLNIAHTSIFSIKEAVSKALGLGLRINFKNINILLDGRNIEIELNNLNCKEKFSVNLYLYNNYICTLIN